MLLRYNICEKWRDGRDSRRHRYQDENMVNVQTEGRGQHLGELSSRRRIKEQETSTVKRPDICDRVFPIPPSRSPLHKEYLNNMNDRVCPESQTTNIWHRGSPSFHSQSPTYFASWNWWNWYRLEPGKEAPVPRYVVRTWKKPLVDWILRSVSGFGKFWVPTVF
jgi:hypothetical protein